MVRIYGMISRLKWVLLYVFVALLGVLFGLSWGIGIRMGVGYVSEDVMLMDEADGRSVLHEGVLRVGDGLILSLDEVCRAWERRIFGAES